jgi:uncharacterized protein involved in exopolysaccharide biosynthesis
MRDEPREALVPREDALDDDGISLLELAALLAENLKFLVGGALLAGVVALGITYLIKPTFTARTTFLPPQQQQSVAASALASLGALAGLAGGVANVKSPADQYVALMQSNTVADQLIDQFDLMSIYEKKFRTDARQQLARNVRISVGRKDGLITVEVDDFDPRRAADLANRHVDELRRLTDRLALTEAQQRRLFFEGQLHQTRDRLTQAQQALQQSGFNAGALKAEPKAAAEGYAKLKAEATAAEVRLQVLRRNLADDTPEVEQQRATVAALRAQLARAEEATEGQGGPDYVGKYREFKYQETLFDLFAKQYELARVDESREGALIQVVDKATPPERKSKPKRAATAMVTTLLTGAAIAAFLLMRHSWRRSAAEPGNAEHIARVRQAFGRRVKR